MTTASDEVPIRCAICGTSLLDKPRIADLCMTCDHAVHDQGDMSILGDNQGDEEDEPWRGK